MKLNNALALVAFSLLVLFWPVALFVPRLVMFDFVNGLTIGIGAAVLYAYYPALKAAVRERVFRRSHYFILSILMLWMGVSTRFTFVWVWRLRGEPEGGLDSIWMAYSVMFVVVSGILSLLTPTMTVDGATIPRRGWISLICALTLGVVLGVGIGLLHWTRL